ncbi:YoaK family protein [Sphaerisporangium fuscum]|uniref:YoaK family protein n=1 Tax=Sphaerisporangium fuscum TaxID=2835868 RepID=UPI001BDCD455|nr:YoaK family protein [Sphaerisporangium fuscum]
MTPLFRRAGRDPLPPALLVMTVLSGAIDAVSYLALGHVFTVNMTGNVLVLGFAAAGAPGFSAVASLVSLGCFLAGAVLAGRVHLRLRSRRARFVVAASGEGAALGVAAVVAAVAGLATAPERYAVIALLAAAMGSRNATVRLLEVPELTTTVMTRTLASLAAESPLAGGAARGEARRAVSVLCLILGACLGALLLGPAGVPWVLLLVAACATLTAVAYAAHPAA